MPLADQQPGRQRLLLLRKRASQRIALLRGARAHCISVGRSAAQQPPRDARNSRDLLNPVVGGKENCWRYCEAERFGGLEIDDYLEFPGLLDWQVAGFFAFDHRSGGAKSATRRD